MDDIRQAPPAHSEYVTGNLHLALASDGWEYERHLPIRQPYNDTSSPSAKLPQDRRSTEKFCAEILLGALATSTHSDTLYNTLRSSNAPDAQTIRLFPAGTKAHLALHIADGRLGMPDRLSVSIHTLRIPLSDRPEIWYGRALMMVVFEQGGADYHVHCFTGTTEEVVERATAGIVLPMGPVARAVAAHKDTFKRAILSAFQERANSPSRLGQNRRT